MPEGPLGAPRLTNIGPLSRSTKQEIKDGWGDCPKHGKEAEICKEIKKASIAILEDQWMFPDCKDISDINGGNCYKIADHVYENVDGVRVMKIADGEHFWIKYNNRHYDAEVPTGIRNHEDLPTVARLPNDTMLKWARRAAEEEGRSKPETLEETVVDVTEERYS